MGKKVLITGILGMDGSHLADFLLEKGYEIYGIVRRSSTRNTWRIEHIKDKIHLIYGDLTDQSSLDRAIKESNPDEIYNLAAQSFVGSSWIHPEQTNNVNYLGNIRILESIRKINPKIKFYQASSSEIYGKVQEIPQNEKTQHYPRSPYGVSKLSAHWNTIVYRESFDIFACSGILFNHSGIRRGIEFVTRKITDGVARIKLGLSKELVLGNLNAKRDIGNSKDYVRAMYLMMQQEKPETFIIATGKTYSIREIVEFAFENAGMKITWEGDGLYEVGKVDDKIVVRVSEEFYRPNEVDLLIGNSTKAREKLGWIPEYDLPMTITEMVEEDLKRLKEGRIEL